MKTYKTNHGAEASVPVLVKNPFTGDFINVLPLFEFMDEGGYTSSRGPEEMVKAVQYILDRTATTVITEESDPSQWVGVNRELLQLRRMFERMSVVKG